MSLSSLSSSSFEQRVQTGILTLFEDAGLPLPTPENPICPVAELLGENALIHNEIDDLTLRKISDILLRRGGISSSLDLDLVGDDAKLAGFLYANRFGAAIFTQRNDPIGRRRFSAAHELGHWVLHWPIKLRESERQGLGEEAQFIEALEPVDDSEATSATIVYAENAQEELPDTDTMEREADAFATALLMPAPLVRAVHAQFSGLSDEDCLLRLANAFLVSPQTMRRRLTEIGQTENGQTEIGD